MSSSEEEIQHRIEEATGSEREKLLGKIESSAAKLVSRVEEMWTEVDEVLGLSPSGARNLANNSPAVNDTAISP